MNLNIEFDECVKSATALYESKSQATNYCSFIKENVSKCKKQCSFEDNQLQQQGLNKCIKTSVTDAQLDQCMVANKIEPTIKLCNARCEITATEAFDYMKNTGVARWKRV